MSEHPSLKGLYPFLHGARQDPDAMRAALLESVRQKAQDSVTVKQRYFAAHGPAVVAVADAIATAARAATPRISPSSSCTRSPPDVPR